MSSNCEGLAPGAEPDAVRGLLVDDLQAELLEELSFGLDGGIA
jgi:hypothetical protein